MKVIIYSDLHLHNHHKLVINSETALNFLIKIKRFALENNIKTIYSLGDFFHTKAKAYAPHVVQALLRLKDLNKSDLEQIFLVGNHDMANPTNSMNSILFTFSDYVRVVSDYYYIDIENTRIHFLSYTNKPFENFILAENKKNVLMTHLDIVGFVMSNGFSAINGFKIEDFKDFDLVFTGHYHKHQHKANIVYVGSPYQTNSGERDQVHGFIVFDTETLEWEFHEYEEAPKYKNLNIAELEDLREDLCSNNFLKVRLLEKKLSPTSVRDKAFAEGALSISIIPYDAENIIEDTIEKNVGDSPTDLAAAYLNSLSNVDEGEIDQLLKYFSKIEEVANNISEYEV